MSKSKIHEMGSVLRKNGVVTLDDWETYLLHQEEIVSELARKLNDFVDSKVIPGSLFSCWGNMVRLVVGRTLSFVSH